jgi:hypothetical protein
MINGMYTIGELRALLANKDAELATLAKAQAAFDPTWKLQDPAGEATWQIDYAALLDRYGSAKTEAQIVVGVSDLNPVPADLDVAGDAPYHGVVSALQATSGAVSTGDFQDLWNRLTTAQGVPIPEAPLPHPTGEMPGGRDLDLVWYKKLADLPLPKPTPTNFVLLAAVAAGAAALAIGGRSTTVVVKRDR